MRKLYRLAIILFICLLAIPMLAVPAQAQEEDDPSITLDPTSGHPGEEVTVRGYFFDSDDEVDIYFYRNGSSSREKVATDETDNDGDFRVTFIVPESYTGQHDVRIYYEGSSSMQASEEFIIVPWLEIDPEEGPVGTRVEVNGTGFGEDETDIEVRYYLDGSEYEKVVDDIQADEYGSWDITFTVPVSSSGNHKIRARGDDSSLGEVEDAIYEVMPGISIDETSGHVGDTIVVNGSGFKDREDDIEIFFDDEVMVSGIKADSNGAWDKSFSLPEMPKGTYDVTAEGENTDKDDINQLSFQLNPWTLLSPTQGHVDTAATISGTGFAADKEMTIRYDDTQVGTGSTNGKGSFSNISFSVPKSKHGEHPVTAEDTLGNAVTVTFTMEAQPPAKPALVSPGNGDNVGLVGSITPTFQWSAVTDDSGVTYSFQLGDSKNLTAPLVLITGLTEASYTLTDDQSVNYGAYYWRVKAIDNAQNDSGWSTVYSFQAGLLSLWLFIVIIALVVVLIGFLVYFFIWRRSYYD